MPPFIGEIREFGGNFAPAGWAFCDGSLLPISENDTLFQLLGTTYGGDGQSTFGLPDLRGRVAVGAGNLKGTDYVLGQLGGVENVTLTLQGIPSHNHSFLADGNPASATSPQNSVPAVTTATMFYSGAPTATFQAGMIAPTGGSQPHENMMPYVAISYIIALFGAYPQQ